MPEPEVVEEAAPVPEVEPVVVETPTGALIVRLHAQSDAEMPKGAVAVVTVDNGEEERAVEISKGERLVRFDGLEYGRYDFSVGVRSGGVEIGSFSYFVDVAKELSDITARVAYARADLEVVADVETAMERRYVGNAGVVADACPDAVPSGTVPSDLDIATDGGDLQLVLANFQRETLRLSGRISPSPAASVATGSFESSTGISGSFQITALSAPTPLALAAGIEFENSGSACRWTLDFAGLAEVSAAPGASDWNEPLARIEVVGHGQTRETTLGRGESVARFDGLLVGPYDLYVGVHDGDRLIDGKSESVVVTEAGASVRTTFQVNWAPPAGARMAAATDYGALSHTFDGKSLVVNGAPECTGSIPLVDSTQVAIVAQRRALKMTFDHFFGKVLELNGVAGDQTGAFSASGTYESSDGKTGSWTIGHLGVPTHRSLAMQVDFHNETDSCRATYEFAGVR